MKLQEVRDGGSAGGAATAAPAGRPDIPQTPLTNRGSFTPPKEGLDVHLDYLKVTVFSSLESVQQLAERHLLEESGQSLESWCDRGPGARWARIITGPGMALCQPREARSDYTMLELKGEGCDLYRGLLPGLLDGLARSGLRWRSKRIDVAWDHHSITPRLLDRTIRRGDLRSRTLTKDHRDWRDNEAGQTCYLGLRKHHKERMLRCYNSRGFNRLELEVTGGWAESLGERLVGSSPDRWPVLAVGVLRGAVDFVDRKANARVDRCPLLPWWSSFIGEAEKIKMRDTPSPRTGPAILPIGQAEVMLEQIARRYLILREALGPEWIEQRARLKAGGRLTDADRLLIQSIKRFRYSGLAGTPTEPPEAPEEVPF